MSSMASAPFKVDRVEGLRFVGLREPYSLWDLKTRKIRREPGLGPVVADRVV